LTLSKSSWHSHGELNELTLSANLSRLTRFTTASNINSLLLSLGQCSILGKVSNTGSNSGIDSDTREFSGSSSWWDEVLKMELVDIRASSDTTAPSAVSLNFVCVNNICLEVV
jgi:hypothetical protein